ncbi:MAG: hypothetical protein M0Z27_07495 [Thermaerobacter sp.]|nr:hypothetical protein [Thermaerobacter sp.]
MLIGLILPEDHPWREQAPAVGQVVWAGDTADLTTAGRAALDVLLIDLQELGQDSLEDVRRYRVARPQTRIVAGISPAIHPGDVTAAFLVSLGVYDLVPQDAPLAETLASARTYADAARWHTDGLPPAKAGRTAPHRGPEHNMPSMTVEVPRVVDPRFFVCWGPKSAGRTALAINLAALVARRVAAGDGGHARVVLLDLDVEGGDAGTFLGVPAEADGLEPLARLGHLDGAAVRRHAHSRFGVDVIPAGPAPSQVLLAERFGGKAQEAESFAARLLAAAQAEYPFVVVDAPAHLAQPFAYTALANAKEVLFCVRPARAGLRRAISVLDLAGTCGIDREKFRLVVNGAAPGGVGTSEISEALALKVAAVLPADLSGHLAAEMAGRPYVLAKDRFEWERLANAVFPAPQPAAGRRTGILRLIGGVLRRDKSAEG